MTTLALLRSAVADDLERSVSELTSQITTEINNTIRFHARRRFWFNPVRSITFNTAASTEFYGTASHASIPYLTQIDQIVITDGSIRYPLIQVDNNEMELMAMPTTAENRPTNFAYFVDEIRLYPIPNAAYALRVNGMVSPVALSADADTNTFVLNAFDLIRHGARRRVMANTLKDVEGALVAAEAERSELDSLTMQSVLLQSAGGIVASTF